MCLLASVLENHEHGQKHIEHGRPGHEEFAVDDPNEIRIVAESVGRSDEEIQQEYEEMTVVA